MQFVGFKQVSDNTILSEMELLFGIVWEIPRTHSDSLCSSGHDLEVAMAVSKCPDWNVNGDVLDIVVYPNAQLKQVKGYGTTPLLRR